MLASSELYICNSVNLRSTIGKRPPRFWRKNELPSIHRPPMYILFRLLKEHWIKHGKECYVGRTEKQQHRWTGQAFILGPQRISWSFDNYVYIQ